MGLAVAAEQSVHGRVTQHLIYVRRSCKGATDADVSDEVQEAACRAILPAGASVRVISDSGGHQSGSTAARRGYRALVFALAAGEGAAIVISALPRRGRRQRENEGAIAAPCRGRTRLVPA